MEYPDVCPVTTPSGLLSLEGGGYYSLAGRVGDVNLGREGLGLGVGCLWTLVLRGGGAVAEPSRALLEGVGYLGRALAALVGPWGPIPLLSVFTSRRICYQSYSV